MSGIVGMWNLDGCPVDPALLAKLSAPLAHRGPDGEGRWIGGPVGFACQNFWVTPESVGETQPLVHSSGVVVVFDGRLDNRDELLALLGQSPEVSPQSSDCLLVAAAYVAFGDAFAERLNGDFALGLFDPNRQQLILARDAIGIRPLHYCRAGKSFLFASEIKSLLAHPLVPVRPDDGVLADFLLMCRSYGDPGRTFFEDVHSVPPGHLAVVTPQGSRTRCYWDFDPNRRIRLGSFPEYLEGFRHHFVQAVRRRLRSSYPVAVSVSGGLDSSSIFCVAETESRRSTEFHPPLGISYTSADGAPSDEKRFLLDIERRYGVRIIRHPVGSAGPAKNCRNEVWHVEAPFLDPQDNSTHEFFDTVHQLGPRVLLTGHWGDQVMFDTAYLVDLFRRFAWTTVWAHLKEFRFWCADVGRTVYIRHFVRELVKHHAPAALVPLIQRLLARTIHARNFPWYTKAFWRRAGEPASQQVTINGRFRTAHAGSIYQQVRRGCPILWFEWNNKMAAMHNLEIAFPFLDRDLLCFLMAIPGEILTWKGIHKAFLREGLRDIVPSAILERRGKADFTEFTNEGMERDFPEVIHRIRPSGMAVRLGYVGAAMLSEQLKQVGARIRGPNCLASWRLTDLLALELWLQVYFAKTKGELTYAKRN